MRRAQSGVLVAAALSLRGAGLGAAGVYGAACKPLTELLTALALGAGSGVAWSGAGAAPVQASTTNEAQMQTTSTQTGQPARRRCLGVASPDGTPPA